MQTSPARTLNGGSGLRRAYGAESMLATRRRGRRRVAAAVLLCIGLLVGACAPLLRGSSPSPTGVPEAPVPTPASAQDAILSTLENIQQNGFDNDPQINHGLGGLWVNWRYGTSPLQTNFNGTGQPDGSSVNPPRHDRLTDLRYVHILWMYKSQHLGNTRFDAGLARYTAILKAEFSPTRDERGWLYDEFLDLYDLSGDRWYKQASDQLAAYFDASLYHPEIGTIYQVDSRYPNGSYRVDLALEAGCALIEAGTLDGNSQWVADGSSIVQFVYAHALVPGANELVFMMNNVLLPGGGANPDETIYLGTYGHTTVHGGQVKLGETAQEILSLLHVYMITHNRTYLDDATTMLDPLTAQSNPLRLWDRQNLGYFDGIVFNGPDIQHAGTPLLNNKSKESGRQLQMLEAFRVANALTNGGYQTMQDLMEQVAVQKAYYAPGHGYLYQETVDWKPPTLKNGVAEDWVTTEAMGIAMEGLLSLGEPQPW